LEDVNLRAMGTLAERFKLAVGLSDHSQGTVAALAAAALGATILEKHFTLDRSLPGPDHAASLVPAELAAMVEQVRGVERALGSAEKGPTHEEVKTREVVRKRLVAARPLKPGEPIDETAIAIKRAPRGMSPVHYWELLGTAAKRSYRPDEPFDQ
jgi:N-acetylneuraminate synthase